MGDHSLGRVGRGLNDSINYAWSAVLTALLELPGNPSRAIRT